MAREMLSRIVGILFYSYTTEILSRLGSKKKKTKNEKWKISLSKQNIDIDVKKHFFFEYTKVHGYFIEIHYTKSAILF